MRFLLHASVHSTRRGASMPFVKHICIHYLQIRKHNSKLLCYIEAVKLQCDAVGLQFDCQHLNYVFRFCDSNFGKVRLDDPENKIHEEVSQVSALLFV